MIKGPFASLSNEMIKVPKGTVLMREGEIGRSAYLVLEGRLLVERMIDGENVIIAEIMPRDLVGEMAILDNEPRSATVTALEDSLLIEFDKHRIKSIIRRSPDIAEVILKLLSHKLRTTHFIITRSSQLNQPLCWIKVCSILKLCYKAEKDPARLFSSFLENLQVLVDIPQHRLRLVIERLSDSRIIESQDKTILSVNVNRLDSFYLRCFEENANEVFNYTSAAKQYEAVVYLRFYFRPSDPRQEWVDVSRNVVIESLINADLWKNLALQTQYQRAESLIRSLVRANVAAESPVKSDEIRLSYSELNKFEKPEESIQNYELLKKILFYPVPSISDVSSGTTIPGYS